MKTRSVQRGAVALVALCLAAVIAISLASYVTISQRAMTLSNRTFNRGLSQQLAEAGLERALWAFNRGDWSGWTISGTTATRTFTESASTFGSSGVSGTIKVRIDDYDAPIRGATWSASKTYQIGDLVGRNGVWYRCTIAHTNQQPPNLQYWMPEGVPWQWNSTLTYREEDVVNYNGTWYRYTHSDAGNVTPPGTSPVRWTEIPEINPTSWPGTSGSIRNDWGDWFLLSGSTWNSGAPLSWRWRDAKTYSVGDVVCYGNVWYRCVTSHVSSSSWWPTNNRPNGNSGYWVQVENYWAWSSSSTYQVHDVVWRNNVMYRCIQAHTNQQPPNATYWTDTPLENSRWTSSRSYSVGDLVRYNGNWYRCTVAHSNQQPPNTAYWQVAPVVYVEGTANVPDGTTVSTQLRAELQTVPLFPNAVGAIDDVSFTSSTAGSVIDSYDSNQGTQTYNQTTSPFSSGSPNAGFEARVAGGSETTTAVTYTRGTINGYVAAPGRSTTPFARVSFGSNAIVRGTSSGTGVDYSRVVRTPFIPQLSTHLLATPNTLTVSSSGTTTIGVPGSATPIVYNINSNLDLSSGTLRIVGPVILNISGRLYTYENGSRIVITPTGSAIIRFTGQLYLGDFLGTPAGIENQTFDPARLFLYGTSSSTPHYFWSTLPLYGTIYMPNTELILWNNAVIYGAVAAEEVSSSYPPIIRYDTSLRDARHRGVDAAYLLSNIRELTDAADRITF